MQCPKCKKEIEDKSLICPNCGKKIGAFCKHCGTYNLITATECSGCGEELLRICSECGSANLPDAVHCRKCGIEFLSKESEKELFQPIYFADMNSQQKIKSMLIEGIKDADKKIITLCGENGSGKNLVIRCATNELKDANIVWMLGTCTQISQLSPFGYFQDMLLSFFNINNFCPDTLQLKKNSFKFFKQDFPALNNEEIVNLLNFLYPEKTDIYENIYYNKAKTFTIIKKVIETIISKTKIIFIIDHFEYIDGMSFDFLKELLSDDLILNRCKFIITHTEARPGQGLISSPKITPDNYLDLSIAPFTPTQVALFLNQYNSKNLGKDFINLVTKISGGNPAIIEQAVLLHKEIKQNDLKDIKFSSLEDIMKLRLTVLKQENYRAYKILSAMSVLGQKFYPAMLENFDNNSPQDFEKIFEVLLNKGYISQLTGLSFEFKSTNVWHAIVSVVKNDEIFESILSQLYDILSIYKQSSIALIGYIVQKLNDNDKAFEIWTQLMKQASYVGDIGLYIISQKQALKLIEHKPDIFHTKVKKNIYTRVGKLLEPIDHNAAFEYLQQAVLMLEDNEEPAHIELLGYIASCAMKSGNYYGAIECIENVLNKLPENMKFERILVKTRLITPLLKLGNYGQIVNTVETEILSELEKYIVKGKDTPAIKISDLFDTWINVYFNFAEALVYQGNNKAFEILDHIWEILDKNNQSKPDFICRINLLTALANTVRGDIKQSRNILDNMIKDYSIENMDAYIVSGWNLTDILNNFLEKNYTAVQTELFNVAAYANNINDSFTKNILKTLLAKILKENNQTKKALEILEEQVAYFAKEKVATGVLLSWYLIAEIKLITNGTQFALDIAAKALDIAQGPNINNYYFMAMFNKLIGEIYIAKQDFESAKVYIEKSIFIARQFNLQYIMLKSYLLGAKLYQELALPKSASRPVYIKQALKMFKNAKNVPIVADNNKFQRLIKEELNILTSFCKLNNIILKKEAK